MHRISPFFALMALTVLLAGCDIRHRFDSAEDRINAAFPLSVDARQARERYAEKLGEQSAERAALDQAWAGRLRVRALSCSPEFIPNWRHANADILAGVKDKACFAVFDRKLLRWLGVQRLRMSLAQPVLSTAGAAASAPRSFVTEGRGFSLARDAGEAPVLAMETIDGFELIALDSGRSLFKERGTRNELSVAPNGRVFAQSGPGMVRVRLSEGGETLLELPEARAVHWLGKQFLGVRGQRGAQSNYLVDLRSGEEVALPFDVTPGSVKLLPVPDSDKRFNVLTYQGIFQFEVNDLDGRPNITLVAEKPGFDPRLAMMDPGSMSTDGKQWIFGQRKLIRFDPQSLELQETSFEPAQVHGAWATPKPGQYVVNLAMRGGGGGPESRYGHYVFDSSDNTLARVSGPPGQRLIRYFPAVKRLAQIDQGAIRLTEQLETAAPEPVDRVISDMLDESNQRVLAQATSQVQRMGLLPSLPPALPPDSPLMAQMRGAQVEAVGVYEASEKLAVPGQSRTTGKVVVTVRRTSRPVVLVLTSYEPVQWHIQREAGARVATVLLGGYYESSVQGAGDARVLRIGREYAYKSEGEEYYALQRQVQRWTGQPIGVFQGGYKGASFSVGGS